MVAKLMIVKIYKSFITQVLRNLAPDFVATPKFVNLPYEKA